jgi:hypothetical protein
MSRGVFSTSNYLSRADAALTAEPLTFAAWVYTASIGVTSEILILNDTGNIYGRFELRLISSNQIEATKAPDGGEAGTSLSGNTVSASTWNHVAAVFTSDTSRRSYLNGTASTENTTNIADPTVDMQAIGARIQGGMSIGGSIYIAHAAIWTVILSATEIQSLASGISPLLVQPASLARYWKCNSGAGNELDYSGNSATLTMTGTVPEQSTNPTILESVVPIFPFTNQPYVPKYEVVSY